MTTRVVFDTTTVISALIFSNGCLAWLRRHWREGDCVPLLSKATAEELTRVLAYPKFRLLPGDRHELLAEYIPFCESIEPAEPSPILCRDKNDQPFLDLAHSGKADLLVTGDRDLLDLVGQTAFLIETPESYRRRLNAT